jgi:hypothetical protein
VGKSLHHRLGDNTASNTNRIIRAERLRCEKRNAGKGIGTANSTGAKPEILYNRANLDLHRIFSMRFIKVALVTATAGFATGGAGFALAPALIAGGSALASLALDELMRGRKGKAERRNEQGYARGGDQPVSQGFPIPLVFCNRQDEANRSDYHPEGGCYVGKYLINQIIECHTGRTWLSSIYLISAGQAPGTNYGAIAQVSEGRERNDDRPQLLVNGQPVDNYNNGWSVGEDDYTEIDIEFRAGTATQPAYAGMERIYSQVVNVEDLGEFGIDRKTEINGSPTVISAPPLGLVNAAVNGRTVKKTSGGNSWNAGAFGSRQVRRGQWFQFSPGETIGQRVAAGLSASDTDQTQSSIRHGFLLLLGTNEAQVIENGAVIPTAPLFYAADSLFVIRWTADDTIQYELDGVVVHTSAIAPAPPLFPDIALWSAGATIDRVRTSAGGIAGSATETALRFTVDDDERINPGQKYLVGTNCYGTPIDILAKRDQPGDDLFSAQVIPGSQGGAIAGGQEIYSYSKAAWSTIGRVNRLDLLLRFYLYRRNEDGKLSKKGMLFDLWIRPIPAQGVGWRRLCRVFVKGKSADYIYRMLSIRNLPLGNYRLKIEPLICDPGGVPIWELDDKGREVRPQTGVNLFGRSVVCYFEGTTSANVEAIGFNEDDYPQTSSQEQMPGALVSVNQVVEVGGSNEGVRNTGNSDNLPLPRYLNLATMKVSLSDSRYLGQRVNIDPYVYKGQQIPNLMAAGNAIAGSSSNSLATKTNLSAIAKVGWIVRNLRRRTEAPITGVMSGAIATGLPLNWEAGDPYLIYFIGASAYLPDIFAYLIRSEWGGIPRVIDPDLGVDYWSLVKSRQFCVANKYFWDDSLDESESLFERIERELPGSRLMPYQPDGRVGCLPDERMAPKLALNQESISDYEFDYDSRTHPYNRVQVNYRDGRMLFERQSAKHQMSEVIFETVEAFKQTSRANAIALDFPAVTRRAQAIEVASSTLKSYIFHRPTINFKTDYGTLESSDIEVGDVVSVSHCWSAVDDIGGKSIATSDGFKISCTSEKGNVAASKGKLYVPDAARIGDRLFDCGGNFVAEIVNINNGVGTPSISTIPDGCYLLRSGELREGVAYWGNSSAVVTERMDGTFVGASVPDGEIVNVEWYGQQSTLWRITAMAIADGIVSCTARRYDDRTYNNTEVANVDAARFVLTVDNQSLFFA